MAILTCEAVALCAKARAVIRVAREEGGWLGSADAAGKQALIEAMPRIIAESVKPMERIDAIKILQVNGLNGGGGSTSNGSNGSLADEMVNSALKYWSQAPLVDSLMKELGLDGSSLGSMAGGVAPVLASTLGAATAHANGSNGTAVAPTLPASDGAARPPRLPDVPL